MRRSFARPVCWVVLSPVYDDGDYYGPPEPGRDMLYAFTRTAQRAKVLVIRAWRRHWRNGCHWSRTVTPRQPYIVRYNDENPLAVLTVERERLS